VPTAAEKTRAYRIHRNASRVAYIIRISVPSLYTESDYVAYRSAWTQFVPFALFDRARVALPQIELRPMPDVR